MASPVGAVRISWRSARDISRIRAFHCFASRRSMSCNIACAALAAHSCNDSAYCPNRLSMRAADAGSSAEKSRLLCDRAQTCGIAHASGVNESARALPVMRQHERMLPSPVVALLPPRQSAHRLHCRTSRFHDLSPAVLSSHLYRGEIVHKGVAYPGQHAAIVPKPLWEKVQAILTENDKGLGAP